MKLMPIMKAALVAAFLLPASANADTCRASYYWEGQLTAQGKRFDPNGMTAAHKSLPFGTRLRVSYRGRSVVVTINDRGPYIKGRCLDLSLAAAREIGLTRVGVAPIQFEKV